MWTFTVKSYSRELELFVNTIKTDSVFVAKTFVERETFLHRLVTWRITNPADPSALFRKQEEVLSNQIASGVVARHRNRTWFIIDDL